MEGAFVEPVSVGALVEVGTAPGLGVPSDGGSSLAVDVTAGSSVLDTAKWKDRQVTTGH